MKSELITPKELLEDLVINSQVIKGIINSGKMQEGKTMDDIIEVEIKKAIEEIQSTLLELKYGLNKKNYNKLKENTWKALNSL